MRLRLHHALPLTVGVALLTAACDYLVGTANAEELEKSKEVVVEDDGHGKLIWKVDGDGDTLLAVKDGKGKVVQRGVTGQLVFENLDDPDAKSETVDLAPKGESGVLAGDGPSLKGSITQVRYKVVVDGKPRSGVLHLPEEGTKGLAEESAASAVGEPNAPEVSAATPLAEPAGATEDGPGNAEPPKADKARGRGPHGGALQRVDGRHYEVVGNEADGAVRVYVLDDRLEPSDYQPKRVRLALGGPEPRYVVLTHHDDGYFVADVHLQAASPKLTLVVTDDDDHDHVVLVGWRPGIVVVLEGHPHGHHWGWWWHPHGGPPGLARGHYKHGGPGWEHDDHGHGDGDGRVIVHVEAPRIVVHERDGHGDYYREGKGGKHGKHGH